MAWKKILFTAVKITVSLGVLYWVLQDVDLAALADRMDLGAFLAVGVTVLMFLAQAFGVGLRWRLVLGVHGLGDALSPGQAWRNVMMGMFFNQALPSTIGGDAVRVWDAKRSGLDLLMAARTILVDRMMGFVGLMALCAVGLPFLYVQADDPRVSLGILILLIGGLTCLFLMLTIRLLPVRVAKTAVLRPAVALSETTWQSLTNRGSRALMAFLLLLPQFIDIFVVWLLVLGVGADVALWQVALLFPSVMFAATIPISVGGWGLREGAMVLAFGLIGVSGEDAVAVSLLFGFATLCGGLLGGAVWVLADPDRARALRRQGVSNAMETETTTETQDPQSADPEAVEQPNPRLAQ